MGQIVAAIQQIRRKAPGAQSGVTWRNFRGSLAPMIDPAAYAAFLLATHDSFGRQGLALPRFGLRHLMRSRRKPWKRVLEAALWQAPAGPVLEFGVWKGRSLNHLAALRPDQAVHGFDSFTGFPDDGRGDWQLDFALPAPPAVAPNVTLHIGAFEQTLPRYDGPPPAFLHIDCDLYSSARTVLFALGDRLGPGSVILFDELLHYTEFAWNEMLALYEVLLARGLDFEWLVTYGRAYPLSDRQGQMIPGAGFADYRARGFYQNAAIRLVPRKAGGHFAPRPVPVAMVDQLEVNMRSALAANRLRA